MTEGLILINLLVSIQSIKKNAKLAHPLFSSRAYESSTEYSGLVRVVAISRSSIICLISSFRVQVFESDEYFLETATQHHLKVI